MTSKYIKNKLQTIIEDTGTSNEDRLTAIGLLADINKEQNINIFSYVQLFIVSVTTYGCYNIHKFIKNK